MLKPYRPLRGRLVWVLWFAVAVVLLFVAVYFGRYQERQTQILDPAGRQQLSAAVGKITAMERDQMVDRLTLEESRQAIKNLEEKVYELNKAVSFYRSIMEPEDGKIGLRIRNLELQSLPGNRVRLSWMLAQVGKKRSVVEGNVEVRLFGASESQQTMLSLTDLVGEELNSKFKFRYFQNYSIDFEIPADYSMHEVEIHAQTEGKKVQTVSSKIDWIMPERVADVAE